MATMSTASPLHTPATTRAALLVSVPPLAQGRFEEMWQTLAAAFSGMNVLVATPDAETLEWSKGLNGGGPGVVGYTPAAAAADPWTLTAADYVNAHELSAAHEAKAVLLLGPECQSLDASALRGLADAVLDGSAELAMSRYHLPPRAGLVNSAILYPVSRGLFGAPIRFPLPLDLCASARMMERLATVGQKFTAAQQPEGLVWPVAEAAVAGFKMKQVEVGSRSIPQPAAPDLNSLLAQIAGSLFADVDSKATYWQRSRVVPPGRSGTISTQHAVNATEEAQAMTEAFRLAYGDLAEIWSLVLPPQSLLGLKRLSATPANQFSMPDSLWARIVYDFLLAYRLRTMNRGHLLGALTPLYLAWVASHILRSATGDDAETQIEELATAFETEKPYLVSRWRWPDRFNP